DAVHSPSGLVRVEGREARGCERRRVLGLAVRWHGLRAVRLNAIGITARRLPYARDVVLRSRSQLLILVIEIVNGARLAILGVKERSRRNQQHNGPWNFHCRS